MIHYLCCSQACTLGRAGRGELVPIPVQMGKLDTEGGSWIISLCLVVDAGLYFWLCCTARGILVPRPGIKPAPPAVEAWSLNHWTAGEVWCWLLPWDARSGIDQETHTYPFHMDAWLPYSMVVGFHQVACLWPSLRSHLTSLPPDSIGGGCPKDLPRFKGKRHCPCHWMTGGSTSQHAGWDLL